jgi:hypothetical protein
MPRWNPTCCHRTFYVVNQTQISTFSLILIVLYVVDLLITGCSNSMIVVVKRILHDKFLMTDMGLLHFFLVLEIIQDASRINFS